MYTAARACAIVTGVVASVCVAVSLTWWSDPSFGHRSDIAVLVVTFLFGLFGWFVMFWMVLARATDSVVVDFLAEKRVV